MTATEYISALILQQQQKITGMNASISDLKRQYFMYFGALCDAKADLRRFKESLKAVEAGEPLPKLQGWEKSPATDLDQKLDSSEDLTILPSCH